MTAKHKGGLVVVLGLGFILSLPLVLTSTPEEKQRLVQGTATMRLVEQQVGILGLASDERQTLKKLLDHEAQPPEHNDTRDAWEKQVTPAIMRYAKNEHDARAIARWVWIYARQHELEPELVLALIAVESQFDPFAVSSVGAQGLMQVMPFWKKELGHTDDNLFDVATNIRYGTAILTYYMQRYRDVRKALAAYNGSKGRDKYPNKVLTMLQQFKPSQESSAL